MKKIIYLQIVIFSMLLLNACKEKSEENNDIKPSVKVKTTHIKNGYLPDYIKFSGKTIYLGKTTLTAPISGYLTRVNVRQGDAVSKGKLLFEMQSPEAFLVKNKDRSATNYGIIKVYAPANGRIVNLTITDRGVYADKGTVMCSILASKDFKIQVNVPFEYNKFAKIGNKCKIILPDNTEITGIFTKIMPQIDEVSQTVKALVKIKVNKYLPENMIVSVLIDKSTAHQTQILPKKCLQTNALMTNFWVMKLINDSIAVQVPVSIGTQTHDSVEIINPIFNTENLFIEEGGYGLSDTVLIEQENKE